MRLSTVRQYLMCPACHAPQLEPTVFEQAGERIVHGVVTCGGCGEWYRVEDGLLELLVPALRNADRTRAFRTRFAGAWQFPESDDAALDAGDEHKIGQRDFYDDDSAAYQSNMLQLSFWRAFDKQFHKQIIALAPRRGCLLEIGGGTGRMSLPTASHFDRVLSFDIAEGMVRAALRDRDAAGGRLDHLEYFVADAENIPVRDGVADAALFSGILHHVARPDVVVQEMARALVPGGRYLGMENNASAFRPIFDLLMRAKRLWNEKAHEDHFIISRAEIEQWLPAAGCSVRVWTSVFLPPHVLSMVSESAAGQLLSATDGVAGALPWLRAQGGLLLFEGTKLAGAGRAPAARERVAGAAAH